MKIAERKDLTICLRHVMNFSQAGNFTAKILNSGKVVHGYEEYLYEVLEIDEM